MELGPPGQVTSKLSKLKLEYLETENNTWWSEGPESDEGLEQRMQELLLQNMCPNGETF